MFSWPCLFCSFLFFITQAFFNFLCAQGQSGPLSFKFYQSERKSSSPTTVISPPLLSFAWAWERNVPQEAEKIQGDVVQEGSSDPHPSRTFTWVGRPSVSTPLVIGHILREHPSGSHDLLVWVSLHDVVQLLLGQKVRDSKLVPLVPFTSHRNVHALLLRLHECVKLHFLVRARRVRRTSAHPEFSKDLKIVTGLQHSGPDEKS